MANLERSDDVFRCDGLLGFLVTYIVCLGRYEVDELWWSKGMPDSANF